MRILLIEDDSMIGKAVREGLVQAGFAVDWVTDGHAAELSMSSVAYDLAILDLGLPKKDGMALLTTLRRMGNHLPIVIVSARDTVQDRIAGLTAGADDYVLKPFDPDELLARVRAVLRRHAGSGFDRDATGQEHGHPRGRAGRGQRIRWLPGHPPHA